MKDNNKEGGKDSENMRTEENLPPSGEVDKFNQNQHQNVNELKTRRKQK